MSIDLYTPLLTSFSAEQRQADFAERLSNYCLSPLRTASGKSYRISSLTGNFEEQDPVSKTKRIASACFALLLTLATLPLTLLGALALAFSKTHEKSYQNLQEQILSSQSDEEMALPKPTRADSDDGFEVIPFPSDSQMAASIDVEKTQPNLIKQCLFDGQHPWLDNKYRLILEAVKKDLLQLLFPEQTTHGLHLSQITALLESQYANDPLLPFCKKAIDNLFKHSLAKTFEERRSLFLQSLTEAQQSQAYKQASSESFCAKLLRKLGNSVISQVNLQEFSQALVFNFLGPDPKEGTNGPLQLAEALEDDFQRITKAPHSLKRASLTVASGKLRGHCNISFTPLHQSNFSSILYQDVFKDPVTNQEHRASCLRMGTPTDEGYLSSAGIVSEFQLFLDHYQETGKKHFYFNHQNPFPKPILTGDETGRCAAIQKLEGSYPDHFFFMNLPFDGIFFNQEKEFDKEELDSPDFLNAFLNKLTEGQKEGYSRPSDETFATVAGIHDVPAFYSQIVRGVYKDFFAEKDVLSKDERIAFQLITYARLEEALIVRFRTDSYNSSCKDCIDRGGVMNALRFYLHLLQTGQERDKTAIEQFRGILHSPAIMVKQQAVVPGRRKLLLKTLRHLGKMSEKERKNTKAWYSHKGLGFSHQAVLSNVK